MALDIIFNAKTQRIGVCNACESTLADDTELVFSSSNENVVTVDEDGYLEALKEGRVTITVKNPASGVKATWTVRVREE